MAICKGAHRLEISAPPRAEQILDLSAVAARHHAREPQIDARAQSIAIQPDHLRFYRRSDRGPTLDLTHGTAGEGEDLQGTDDADPVVGVKSMGDLRINLDEPGVWIQEGLQLCTEGGIGHRERGMGADKRSEIERGPAHNDHVVVLTLRSRHGVHEVSDREFTVRVSDVDAVVGVLVEDLGLGLCGSDVHEPVDGHRIRADDPGAVLLSDSKRGS